MSQPQLEYASVFSASHVAMSASRHTPSFSYLLLFTYCVLKVLQMVSNMGVVNSGAAIQSNRKQ